MWVQGVVYPLDDTFSLRGFLHATLVNFGTTRVLYSNMKRKSVKVWISHYGVLVLFIIVCYNKYIGK